MSGDERGGIQGGASDEVKYSTRPMPTADCLKLKLMPHCSAPAGTADPSHTT